MAIFAVNSLDFSGFSTFEELMTTVDGSLKSGVHQLRLVVFPIIYRVSYIQTVVVWDFSHQQYDPTAFPQGFSSLKVRVDPAVRTETSV